MFGSYERLVGQGFNYGMADRCNKPSKLPKPKAVRGKVPYIQKINQRGMQIWCLLRLLGLILGDHVEKAILRARQAGTVKETERAGKVPTLRANRINLFWVRLYDI
jgi:hypothetical protein